MSKQTYAEYVIELEKLAQDNERKLRALDALMHGEHDEV